MINHSKNDSKWDSDYTDDCHVEKNMFKLIIYTYKIKIKKKLFEL